MLWLQWHQSSASSERLRTKSPQGTSLSLITCRRSPAGSQLAAGDVTVSGHAASLPFVNSSDMRAGVQE